MAIVDTDVVVIGGGCAGLAVAARLARLDAGPRVHVIEPRQTYGDDRTWCFWGPDIHSSSALVAHRWRAWRFSGATEAHVQQAPAGLSYQCVPAGAYYAAMVDTIESGDRVSLHLGTSADRIESRAEEATVWTGDTELRARWVIDTRPDRTLDNGFGQRFVGVEVETDDDRFDPTVAGLMDDMSVDADGFRFTYVLPFGTRRALVEETRFGGPVPPLRLHHELDRSLSRLGPRGGLRVVRREAGYIPMAVTPPRAADGSVVHAGIGAGAARPSTGYAFTRIQRWAESCADRLAAGEAPVGHPPDPPWRRTVDALFLRVLAQEPALAPQLFLDMAAGVPPAVLVRFLSDEGGLRDFARVAGALPKRPFLAELASSGSLRLAS